MTRLESSKTIEKTVGASRHATLHLGRAVSRERRVYILHPAMCVASVADLRTCEYSIALDRGIDVDEWAGAEDRPVILRIDDDAGDLVPVRDYAGAVLPETSLVTRIIDAIRAASMQYVSEDELQAAIAAALVEQGIAAIREVRLSDGLSRIDLLVEDIGIEVKIAGRAVDVTRQLTRYALCPEIGTLILVTNRAAHAKVPTHLHGRPLYVCSLIGGGL